MNIENHDAADIGFLIMAYNCSGTLSCMGCFVNVHYIRQFELPVICQRFPVHLLFCLVAWPTLKKIMVYVIVDKHYSQDVGWYLYKMKYSIPHAFYLYIPASTFFKTQRKQVEKQE